MEDKIMERVLSEPVKEVLKKQCEIVNADYDKLDFTTESSNWFYEYEWTTEQEKEFANWFKKYLKESPKSIWNQFTSFSKNKQNIEKLVDEWCFNYGWKMKKII